jgi:hypothetical protein
LGVSAGSAFAGLCLFCFFLIGITGTPGLELDDSDFPLDWGFGF